MTDDDHDRPRSKRWIALVATPAFYSLSVGPVCWIRNAMPTDWSRRMDEILPAVYYPHVIACEYSEKFLGFMDWYCDLL